MASRGEAKARKRASGIQEIPGGYANAGGIVVDGYFVRTAGNKVTAQAIRQYLRRYREQSDPQWKLIQAFRL
jgi:hypothetical protein